LCFFSCDKCVLIVCQLSQNIDLLKNNQNALVT